MYFYLPVLLYGSILMQKDFVKSYNFPTFATQNNRKYPHNCESLHKYLCNAAMRKVNPKLKVIYYGRWNDG